MSPSIVSTWTGEVIDRVGRILLGGVFDSPLVAVKAIFQRGYGSPDVLELREVEKPAPKEGRILVKVEGASVNPLDWHSIRGKPRFARLSLGLRKPKDPRVGVDFAGKVESVGDGVTGIKPGDEVYGVCAGSFAEYAVARAARVAPKPPSLSFEEAATVPVAATTALQGLRDTGRIRGGQKVLVNGASGGVGSYAVQIAKAYGTDVTGVCSGRNVDIVKSMGADQVIDYTKEDFTKNGRRYDLIYDAVGNYSVSDYRRALNDGGVCAISGFSGTARLIEHAAFGPLRSRFGNKRVRMMGLAKVTTEDLNLLTGMIEAGKVKPLIDRRYPLDQVAEAVRYVETLHVRGKVIIAIT